MPPGIVVFGAYVPGLDASVTICRAGRRRLPMREMELRARMAESELRGLLDESGLDAPASVGCAEISLLQVLLQGFWACLPAALLCFLFSLEGLPASLGIGATLSVGACWSFLVICDWRRSIDRALREVRGRFRGFSSSAPLPSRPDVQFLGPPDAPTMLIRVVPLVCRDGLGGLF